MRKRSRRTPNISESTGKIGQELPSNQLRPLVPLYLDELPAAIPQPRPARPERHSRPESPAKQHQPVRQVWNEPAGSGRLELETQPEMPSLAPPEPEAAGHSPQAPKGFVVLAIEIGRAHV